MAHVVQKAQAEHHTHKEHKPGLAYLHHSI